MSVAEWRTAKKQPENPIKPVFRLLFAGFGYRADAAVSAEEAHFHLDQFFDFGEGAAAGNEDDQVVAVGEFEVVVAAHRHFFAAHHGGEVAA